MHKQDNTTTDKGLNTIVERMYGEGDYMDDPTLNPDWQKAHRSASLAKSMDDKGETEIAQQVRDKGINASKSQSVYSFEDVIEREFLKIVKELKEMGEGDEALNAADAKEGIINLAKENMITNVSMIIDQLATGQHLGEGYGNIGTDADGTEIEQGHIVQYDPTGAHQSDPQVSDAQWIVSGAAVAGPDNEAMVDIIQLGKDISVPAKQLLVQGELGG